MEYSAGERLSFALLESLLCFAEIICH